MLDQTLKKNKIAWNSSFKKSSFMQKNFYKCNHPIFRELYSGVFKPYSDVLKSYSGVFLQKFFISDHPVPGLESPIVAFLSPIVTFLNPIAAFFCNLRNSSL